MNASPSRHYDIRASTLLFISLGAGLLGNLLARQGLFAPAATPYTVGIGVVTLGLFLGLYACIRKGYRWAKILSVGLFVLGLLLFPLTYPVLKTAVGTVTYVVQTLLQFLANFFIVQSLRADKRGSQTQE
ncbi:hypothetical protein [Hymenobacter glacieicola]|uniref:Uncharacterized protein n=1 Tax=Hymenobacter glacieicola TaxID=1562124 RepID=A0ABQ1X5Z9_9BACT|nr:hypothetical protein [Hymenobacter glacieicola]GGG61531.1 hypothetical protein GCM10011378_41950 [Hymenobacter glacieicola]